jgi:hypothetical protein
VITLADAVVSLVNRAVTPVADAIERTYSRWLAGVRADEDGLADAVHHALAASRRARAR